MNTEHDLTSNELDAISGGDPCVAGRHIISASMVLGGSGDGGPTPSGAWNACLGVFGYSRQAA